MTYSQGVMRAAERLRAADSTRTPTEPVRELIGSLDEAYAVQSLLLGERESADNPLVGRKVGLTSAAVQQQLGVDQPDFGNLLADMEVGSDSVIDMERLIQPKVEAEIAFILGRDVDDVDRASVLAAVDWVAPALEIVDSRIRDWQISLFDTVADNASSGLFLLGSDRVAPGDVNLPDVRMSMTADGEPVSSGRGSDCLGDPVNALVWVARVAADQGRPLRAGEVVLSGALGPMVTLTEGSVIAVTISGVGTVSAQAGKREHT